MTAVRAGGRAAPPRPLRVVVVGPPLSASGGIGRVMSSTLDALAGDEGVRLRVLDTRGLRSSPWLSFLPLLRACAQLLLLRARGVVDVAHVNVSSGGSAARKGVVVRVCRLARIPVVLHLHASSFPEFYDQLPGLARRWVRRSFALAAQVIVLAEIWGSYVQDVLEVAPDRVTVLPNATPPALQASRARTGDEPLEILFLGRLGSRKGVPELLCALAEPPLRDRPWRATLAGDGDVGHYRDCATEAGLHGRIDFPGWVGPEAVAQLLAEAHVLVLPSHAEGLPMSVLEAFAAGVPVVSTPVGGLPEVVVEGGNGLLIPAGDAAALSDALLRLLEDEDLRRRLAVGAVAAWQHGHSIDDYVRRLRLEWLVAGSTTREVEEPGLLGAGGR